MDSKYKIKSLANFLEIIQYCIDDYDQLYQNSQTVFRGQSDVEYELVASLFREPKDPSFEYNQIHFLRASKFVNEEDELEIAIRAQHYGYYTRLLDVTYNSLIALYFACEGKRDTDGAVYAISVERYLPSTSIEISDLYKKIIKDADILESLIDVQQSPLIIETIKNNDRIIAQSGAFLLFINSKHKLDEDKVVKIVIPSNLKGKILDQLYKLFSIHNGSVFPDIQSNSKDFNSHFGHLSYSGKNCNDLFISLVNDSLYSLVRKQIMEFKSEIILDDTIKAHKKEQIKRHIRNVVSYYYRSMLRIETIKKSNELIKMFEEQLND